MNSRSFNFEIESGCFLLSSRVIARTATEAVGRLAQAMESRHGARYATVRLGRTASAAKHITMPVVRINPSAFTIDHIKLVFDTETGEVVTREQWTKEDRAVGEGLHAGGADSGSVELAGSGGGVRKANRGGTGGGRKARGRKKPADQS